MRGKMGSVLYMVCIAYRNLYRNKRRSILCMTAIAVAVFFIVFMMGWIFGMLQSMQKTIYTFETAHLYVTTKDFDLRSDFVPLQYPVAFEDWENGLSEFIQKVQEMDGVKIVLPRIASYATLMDSKVKNAIVWGLDTEREFSSIVFNQKTGGNGLVDGRYPVKGENSCAIGARLAKKMGVKIGDKIPLKMISSQFSDKFWSPVVVGLFDFDYMGVDDKYILVEIERLQRIVTLKGQTQKVMVYLEHPEEAAQYQEMLLKEAIQAGIEEPVVKSWQENYFISMMKQFTGIYIIAFLVFIIVASFLIVNTVIMTVHERIKEIGMMGAIGMTRFEIVAVFFLEAVLLSVFGALFGVILGGIATKILSLYPIDLVTLSGGIDMPTGNTMFVAFSWLYLVAGFFFGVIVSSLCTILPSLKSAFIEPVEALRR